ncbi:hypothetical protein DFH94DRAFT_704756 [Russula ochroleuca]|uniref:Uncharacterized protein n=1 Tax=Russula ochroleuca TaxID=152965 RepID=A0A9P5N600_9AGAM|nr:hypothetical protein DFH94DRAFT_704756 [Russula ochroleuca]
MCCWPPPTTSARLPLKATTPLCQGLQRLCLCGSRLAQPHPASSRPARGLSVWPTPAPAPRSGLLGLPSPSYNYCTPRFLTGNVCLSSPDAAVWSRPPRSHQPVRGQQWPWPGQGQRSRRCPAPSPGSRWQVWETPLACCAGRSAYNVLTPGP